MSHATSLRAKFKTRQLELLALEERLTPASDKNSRDTIQGTTGLDLFFASATDILDKIASERTRFA